VLPERWAQQIHAYANNPDRFRSLGFVQVALDLCVLCAKDRLQSLDRYRRMRASDEASGRETHRNVDKFTPESITTDFVPP
jgi:hypothetical protein